MCNIIYLQKPSIDIQPVDFQSICALNAMSSMSYKKNPDGTGMFDGEHITKSTGDMPFHADFDLDKGQWLLKHYRLGTVGEKNMENIQPILHEYRRFDSMMAHNGTLEGDYEKTDSMWLKEQIDEALSDEIGTTFLEKPNIDKAVKESIQKVLKRVTGSMSIFYFVKISDSWYKYYFRNRERDMHLIDFGSFWAMATKRYSDLSKMFKSDVKAVPDSKLFRIEPDGLKPVGDLEFKKKKFNYGEPKQYGSYYNYAYNGYRDIYSQPKLFGEVKKKVKASPSKLLMEELYLVSDVVTLVDTENNGEELEYFAENMIIAAYDSSGEKRFFQKTLESMVEDEGHSKMDLFEVNIDKCDGIFYNSTANKDIYPSSANDAETFANFSPTPIDLTEKGSPDPYRELFEKGFYKAEGIEIKELKEEEYNLLLEAFWQLEFSINTEVTDGTL